MTLMLPFKILTDSDIGPWQMKAFVCRFSAVVFYETMYINIILLGLIGLDRFLKIVRPFGRNWMNNVSQAKKNFCGSLDSHRLIIPTQYDSDQ